MAPVEMFKKLNAYGGFAYGGITAVSGPPSNAILLNRHYIIITLTKGWQGGTGTAPPSFYLCF